MRLDKHRTLQLICFAILMAFLVFAFSIDADACDTKPTNAQELLKLASVLPKPVTITLVRK